MTRRNLILMLAAAATGQTIQAEPILPLLRKNGKTRMMYELITAREYEVREIARIFRLPPEILL